eukprot:3720908-Prymnesium_polylepis.1
MCGCALRCRHPRGRARGHTRDATGLAITAHFPPRHFRLRQWDWRLTLRASHPTVARGRYRTRAGFRGRGTYPRPAAPDRTVSVTGTCTGGEGWRNGGVPGF